MPDDSSYQTALTFDEGLLNGALWSRFKSEQSGYSFIQGVTQGAEYHFTGQGGAFANELGSTPFDWSKTQNTLTIDFAAQAPKTVYFSVFDLVAFGLVSASKAAEFMASAEQKGVSMAVTRSSETWQLLKAHGQSVTLLQSLTLEATFNDANTKTQLLGQSAPMELTLTLPSDVLTLERTLFKKEAHWLNELLAAPWALPAYLAYDGRGLRYGLYQFNADGSGSEQLHNESIAWSISQQGDITIRHLTSQIETLLTRLYDAEEGIQIQAKTVNTPEIFTRVGSAAPQTLNPASFNLTGLFLLSSAISSHPDNANQAGLLPSLRFGFRVQAESHGTRVWDGTASPYRYSYGRDFAHLTQQGLRWLWSLHRQEGMPFYRDCLAGALDCHVMTQRDWQLLGFDGSRLTLLERVETAQNEGDALSLRTPWRLRFYDVWPFDTDKDGVMDTLDSDIDGDGVFNAADTAPYDKAQQ